MNPATTPPSLPQTVVLLKLSRGDQTPDMPSTTRALLLARHWMAPVGKRNIGSKSKRRYEITDSGRRALATSPFMTQALRDLDLPLASWH